MNRFNYRQSRFEQLAGALPGLTVFAQFRQPLAAAGAALILVAGAWTIEAQRLAALDRDLSAIHERARVAATDAARAQRLSVNLVRARALTRRIERAHQTAIASTNAIAQIGNALPVQTWLTSVATSPGGSWTIAGRSAQVAQIGTTLRAIAQLDTHAQARLVSISATGRAGRIHDFVIGWDRP